MYINWSTQVPGPDGILVPTYGNYGGPGYSDGQILTSPNQPVAYQSPPVDTLDRYFRAHDHAYDSPDPVHRAEGDLRLAQRIAALPDSQLDAEASLYGGFATLFAINQILTVNKQPDLLNPGLLLYLTESAVHDIERGLAQSDPGESTSIQSWLVATVGTVANGAANLVADVGQPFDFGLLAHSGPAGSHAEDLALTGLTLFGSSAEILHDAFAAHPPPSLDQASADLQDVLLKPHHGAALYDLFI
jgi:hypothetical protein